MPRPLVLAAIATAALAALVLAACGTAVSAPGQGSVTVPVESITDGDTFRVTLDGRSQPVRIIGIDTPERDEPCFDRATDALADRVEGRRVELVWDAERRDRYDRLLAYVQLGDRDVGRELLRAGLAEPLEVPPNTARADAYAREARGLLATCGG